MEGPLEYINVLIAASSSPQRLISDATNISNVLKAESVRAEDLRQSLALLEKLKKHTDLYLSFRFR